MTELVYTSLGYDLIGEVPATELGRLTMLKLPGDEYVTIELVHDPSRRDIGGDRLSHLVISVDARSDFAPLPPEFGKEPFRD